MNTLNFNLSCITCGRSTGAALTILRIVICRTTKRNILHNDIIINQPIASERSITNRLIGYKAGVGEHTRGHAENCFRAVIVRALSAGK